MKAFFKAYVAGIEALPIEELVAQMGIVYKAKGMVEEMSPFGIDVNGGLTFNTEQALLQILGRGIDPFGKEIMGYQPDDLLYKWNGTELTMQNIQVVLTEHAVSMEEGKELVVTVMRKNKEEKYEEVELKGKMQKMPVEVEHTFELQKNPTKKQIEMRKSWLGDYISR
jgi:hypothetical protein